MKSYHVAVLLSRSSKPLPTHLGFYAQNPSQGLHGLKKTNFSDSDSDHSDPLCSSHTGLSLQNTGEQKAMSRWFYLILPLPLLPDIHMAHSMASFRLHSNTTFPQKPFLSVLSKNSTFSHYCLLTLSITYPLKCVSLPDEIFNCLLTICSTRT